MGPAKAREDVSGDECAEGSAGTDEPAGDRGPCRVRPLVLAGSS